MSLRKRIALFVLGALIASAALPSRAAAAWPHDKLGLVVQSYSSSVRTCPDGYGGTYVAFNLFSASSSSYALYVQRFDATGAAIYAAPGVLVCDATDSQYPAALFSDTYGGCIVAWEDYRTGGQADFYAQRVEGGATQWAANGVPICTATGNQTGLRVESNAGLAWFVWTDPRNTGTTGNDIYAQALSVFGGAPSLAADGQVVCNAAGDQRAPDFEVDDNGYAHIVWQDSRSGGSDIYTQVLSYSGFLIYAANGAVLCDAAGSQLEPRIALSKSNRYFVSWSDLRGADFDVYAASFSNFSTSPFWAPNGIVVCNATSTQFLSEMLVDPAGHLVLLWGDQRRGGGISDLYVQKLDQAGVAQWSSGGMPIRVANGTASYVRAVPDGQGGILIVWQDSRSDISDVYAQRLSSFGSPLWAANGVVVGSGPSSQANAWLVPTGNGGAYVAWDDYYNAPWGCRLQKLDEWGYSGAEPILASVKDIPNDQGGQVKVSWYGSPLDTDPAYRNISDYVVYRSVPTALVAQLARAAATAGAAAEDGVSLNGKRYLRTTSAAQDYFWEELAHVTPRHLSTYSYVAATEGDSMGGSNKKTAFMIMALANYGSSWWTSNADSGYSVDNVAPAAPAPLTGQYSASGTALHWNPNAEADLAGYRVYRGTSVSFVPSPATLVAAVSDTGYVAGGSTPYFYKLTAVDIHGNESPVATLMPSGTLGVGDGPAARAEFAAPAPNPLRGGAASTLRFSLAVGGRTKLALYDAQGRMVRTLVDGAREAGAHSVALRGDGLAPGLYLARLEAPGFTGVRRVMVVE
jgi:hypothetical protein